MRVLVRSHLFLHLGPGMMTSVRNGALLLALVGGTGAAVLWASGFATGDAKLMNGAAVLLALLLVSGALGGLVYARTDDLRDRGWGGVAASWWLSCGAATVVLFGSTSLTFPALGLQGKDLTVAAQFTSGRAFLAIAIALSLFAVLAADLDVRANQRKVRLPAFHAVGVSWLVLLFASGAMVTLFNKPGRPPMTEPFRVGMNLAQQGRFSEAIPHFEEAVSLKPDDAYAHNGLGWILSQMQRYEEALPHIERAVRLAPDFIEAQHNLAWTLHNLDRLEPAESTYRHVITVQKKDVHARYDYAWVLFKLSKDSLALVQALTAIELDPSNVDAHRLASTILRSKARFAEAREHLQHGARLQPDAADLQGEIGVTSYLMHDSRGAVAAFEAAVRLNPDYLAHRPMERRMLEQARQGKTGDVFATQSGDPRSPAVSRQR